MGLGVFHGFDMVVDLHRDHPGLVRNIAADHQHHAELADGVGKTENRRGDKPRARQGQDHRKKCVPGIGPQGRGHFQWASADGGERVLQRLHHERHGVDHRADHQPGKTEGQGTQAQPLGELAEVAVGPHGQQQVKADHRGWQHQRQGHHRANGAAPPRTGARQPQGDRSADDQQDDRGQ